jgi:DNA double-strand break repair helicase HerA and related ATPase
MNVQSSIILGKGESTQHLLLKFANRHGLIAGATGTGKTISLQILAEGFAGQGIPVFMADVKGDLSGISQEGIPNPKLSERAGKLGIKDYAYCSFPTVFWDLFGEQGHPIRATISDMGPLLLSRLLDLNDTQEGVLNVAFKVADDQGLLLLDFKDLRSLLNFVGENSKTLTTEYGTVRKASVGAIQRRLLMLEQQGAENFFGEPALELRDLMRTDLDGRAYINVLAADKLMLHPRLYATFMLWLLSELFEEMPEVGDLDKPRLVFFFDEAHLLFDDAPRALVDKVEQVARLIRSKGVGLYFISQNPLDIPEDILGQLGNRVQHALRAFTPRDQKAVRAAAETFRANPKFDAAKAITELEVGEALVSTLEAKGTPSIVQRTLIRPPSSRIGPASEKERQAILSASPVSGRYDTVIDRESAHEMLKGRAEKAAEKTESPAPETTRPSKPIPEPEPKKTRKGRSRQTVWEAMAKSVARSVGSSLGRQIVRGILGSIFKGK